MRTLNFADHRRELGNNAYVYPVVSRRSRGLSIGVNLNPDKVCNFDCPYCQVDRSVPAAVTEVDMARLERELDHILGLAAGGHLWEIPPFDTVADELRRVNDVAFAGDGEPTTFAGFADAVRLVGRLLEAHWLTGVKPVVLTNATRLHRPAVAEGMAEIDRLGGEIWAKLDAGTEPYFQAVDGTKLPFERILKNLTEAAKVRPILLQCMFLRWGGEAPSEAELDAWAGRIRDILAAGGRIKLVQVYSVARVPHDRTMRQLEPEALERIADRARALGVPAEVYPGREWSVSL
jgi:wyosine [tRNA(Phe)-imidazoG37] synthetase (radical SAM superfamily)